MSLRQQKDLLIINFQTKSKNIYYDTYSTHIYTHLHRYTLIDKMFSKIFFSCFGTDN